MVGERERESVLIRGDDLLRCCPSNYSTMLRHGIARHHVVDTTSTLMLAANIIRKLIPLTLCNALHYHYTVTVVVVVVVLHDNQLNLFRNDVQ